MADKNYSSANQSISVPADKAARVNTKAMLKGLTKDVKQRWLIVGGIALVGVVSASTWMSSANTKPPRPVKEASAIDTTPRGMSKQQDWKAQTGAEMTTMRQQLRESQQAQQQLAMTMQAIREDLKKQSMAPAQQAQAQPTNTLGLNLPPPPEPPKSVAPGFAVPTGNTAPASSQQPPAPVTLAPPVEVKRSAARSFIPPVVVATQVVAEAEEPDDMRVNDRRGMLPAGSFAKASLLSGVEAFTGGTAQSQPQPLVVRLDANAILPNSAAYGIKGCHVLASVWGDMSAERVFSRLATLTCVDSQNRLVLSEEVEGVLIDSDGKNGIRGTLQDRQGAKLARSLLAGFAEGMSTALGAAQSTVTSTGMGAITSVDPSKMVKSSGYGGAGKAAEQLSEFYLKQAEATMPVIAVDSGRKISVLFTKSQALKFETIDQYKVTPKQRLSVAREAI